MSGARDDPFIGEAATEPGTPPLVFDAPTEPGTPPINLEARQILGQVEAALFGEGGASVGRYEIVRKLGAGGMGVVYEAYDPLLDCRVALKQLRPELAAERGFFDRLRREARAMARLRAEPHVATLYDFFVQHDVVFVVMEYIEGATLRGWQRGRSPGEVLDKYLQAGLGLAAAHRAGLVHRDFKPDNAMVSPDGHVRVMDFGLVRAEPVGASAAGTLPEVDETNPLALQLTHGHTLLGTPRYMSPEQWDGLQVDARSDQFSFCVALWEAVYGAPPFAGGSPGELSAAVRKGRLQAPPPGANVPRWLQQMLVRGLATAPERRFPTMEALCAYIRSARARTRLRGVAVGLALVAAGAAGAAGWQQHARSQRLRACEAAGAEISADWNATTQNELRAALIGTEVSYAAATFDRLLPWVDRWTGEWSQLRAAQCVAAEVEATLPGESYARTLACLDDRRDELRALLGVLVEGDATVVRRAVPAVAGLTGVASCVDPTALAQRQPMPEDPALRAAVAERRRDLMRLAGLLAAGRWNDGFKEAEALLTDVVRLGHAPLTAEAELTVGLLAQKVGEYARAEEMQARAYLDASAIGADELAARAVVELPYTVGYLAARYDEGLVWARAAEAAVRRFDLENAIVGATFANGLAAVHLGRSEYAEAQRLFARAAELRERILGPDHPLLADTLNNLGVAHLRRGDHRGARELLERALAIKRRTLGEIHPSVGDSLNNLGNVYQESGDPATALALHSETLAVWERALGPDHNDVALALNNVANDARKLGDLARAQALLERALAIRDKVVGREHPQYATALFNLARVHFDRADFTTAEELYGRALSLREAALGPQHALFGDALSGLAATRLKLGRFDEARELYTRALAVWEAARGPDDPLVADALVGLGEVALATGRDADAVARFERAVELRSGDGVPPLELAEARFLLARALKERAPERARSLAEAALAVYRSSPLARAEDREEIEAWLASAPSPPAP